MNYLPINGMLMPQKDSAAPLKELPVGTWLVAYNPATKSLGLSQLDPITMPDFKTYGDMADRIPHVLDVFASRPNESLGLIAEGPAGTGKTIFARQLCATALNRGIPVILVRDAFEGLAGFLTDLEAEALVLFEEFEKVFPDQQDANDATDQLSLLTYFDGPQSVHHLNVITVNEIKRLSRFIFGRQGRMRYRFHFSYIAPEQAIEYATDHHVDQAGVNMIGRIAGALPATWDLIGALCEETRYGLDVATALDWLNVNENATQRVSVKIVAHETKHPDNTVELSAKGDISLLSDNAVSLPTNARDEDGYSILIGFCMKDADRNGVIDGSEITMSNTEDSGQPFTALTSKGNVELAVDWIQVTPLRNDTPLSLQFVELAE